MATACAFHLPHRVSALTLISPVPPADAVRGGDIATLIQLGRRPALARPLLALARRLMMSPRLANALVFGARLPGQDNAVMTQPLRAALLAAMREGLRPGTAGALLDARLYATPWGFSLTDITTSTTIWHGTEDHLIPPESVQAYAAIPGSQLHMMDGHGHYSLALGMTREIVDELLHRVAHHPSGMARNPG